MLWLRFLSFLRRLVSFRRSAPPPRPERSRSLRIEPLEGRLTPAVNGEELWAAVVTEGLLGRSATASELSFRTGQLSFGGSTIHERVAREIGTTDEAFARYVEIFYQRFLNRPADNNGAFFWFTQLKNGATLNQVKAGFLGSDEFFSRAGSNLDVLDAIYRFELGRPVDDTGKTFWGGMLNRGVSRASVASQILATPEASDIKASSFYVDILGRAADVPGVAFWSGVLRSGTPETNVVGGFMNSNEFLSRVFNFAATTPLTSSTAAATSFITTANLFTGPLPNAEQLTRGFATSGTVPTAPPTATSPPPPYQTVISNGEFYEPNQTSDKASNFNSLARVTIFTLQNLTISQVSNGLPDFDWFRWTMSAGGTFYATLTPPAPGTLEMHVFTVRNNVLTELTSTTGGNVGVPVSAGQTMFVEIKGANSAPGVFGQGTYTLDVGLN